jgi:hypothetical protein
MQQSRLGNPPHLTYHVPPKWSWRRLRWNRKWNSTAAMGLIASGFLWAALLMFVRSTFAESSPSKGCIFTTCFVPAARGPVVAAGTGGSVCIGYGILLLGGCLVCSVLAVRCYFANVEHPATGMQG